MLRKESPIIPIVGCLIVQLCVGILYLWSVFKKAVSDSFGGWNGVTMVASYMLFAFVIGNFIGGYINDKKGPRVTNFIGVILFGLGITLTSFLNASTASLMVLTYCVMGGLGSGIAYGACISCIQKWLPHRRGFASGLAVSAFGLSTVVFTPVSKWLMGVYTDPATGLVMFNKVFLTLGLVFLVLGLIGCFMVKLPSADYIAGLKIISTGKNVIRRDYSLGEAVRTVPFWCIFFSIFFINGTWNLTVPLIYDLGMARGLSVAMATFCVSFTGVPNALGRLIMATVSDKIGRTNTIIVLSAMTFVGAVFMVFAGGPLYIVVVAVIAFAYGGPSATNAAMTTDFFGAKNSGTNYGVAMTALGFSSIFFNAISNNLLKGNVTSTFIMAAVTAIIPIVLMIVIAKYQKSWGK